MKIKGEKVMKNTKNIGILKILIAIIVFFALSYVAYISVSSIKLGLDLAGGVSITYQALDENPSPEQMSDTIYKLQQRVQNYSTEAEVYKEGNNRINIDIPGVSDANSILESLGKPGSLYFQDADGNKLIDGTQVKNAKAGIIQENKGGKNSYVVELTFTDDGTKAFADATSANVGKQISIVYDGKIISSPVVKQAITGGQAVIDGMESYESAQNLSSFIRIGSLSLELEELRSNVVGAKLGQEAISSSLLAGLIGFIILAIFMILVYRLPGLASVIALGIYISLTACFLEAFNNEITLTLPGIAGILLSIGMAVDANVIIFTRIKEEIALGKSIEKAVKLGFNKALSAILDGNITTLIAAAVLYFKGSGTVKGFAQTLALGILLSMFTALFVTRFIINAFVAIGLNNPILYGTKFERKPIDFIGKRKIFFAASLLVIILGFVGMGINKAKIGDLFSYGIDFKGGTLTNVTFNEDLSLDDLSKKVKPVVDEVTKDTATQTTKVKGTKEVIIKTRSLNKDERESLNKALVENFGVDDQKITAESISATVSGEMKKDALVATILSTILMLLYIWFRFKDIRFAASSVLALVHDVLVVIALYALFRWSVGSTFIACILTIVGYSINATIVIFDRIRENKAEKTKLSIEELVNLSVTQTITRSINSSLTTFIMILVLYIVGVSSIREFALPLMAGIVIGTYSSVCLAGAMWYVLKKVKEIRKK